MVNIITKKIIVFVTSLSCIATLYSPISDFDPKNLSASLAMLERIQKRLDAIPLKTHLTKNDMHDEACLTLLGVQEIPHGIEKTIDKTISALKERLSPDNTTRLPDAVKTITEEFLLVIDQAKDLIYARLARLRNPSKTPTVPYPEQLISLQPIISQLSGYLSRDRDADLLRACLKLDLSKLARSEPARSDVKPTDSVAEKEKRLSAHPTEVAACAGAGRPTTCPAAPKQQPRRLARDERRKYVVADLYFVILREEGTPAWEFLAVQTDDEGNKTIYYPALRDGAPATADDFKYYFDEISFLDLTEYQLKQLLNLYYGEGILLFDLTKPAKNRFFPFIPDEEEFNRIIRSMRHSFCPHFTTPKLYQPKPAVERPMSKDTRAELKPVQIKFKPETCFTSVKFRYFFK